MDNRIITGVVSIFAAIIILAAIMVPVIQDAGYTSTTTTTTISNEGAADLKLSKISSGFALDMIVENDGSDLTITNGTDTITAGISPMFILSTDTAAIYVNNVNDVIAVWTSGGNTQQHILTGDFSVEITESYLVIDDGAVHNLPLPTLYMFVPSSTGMYGSFIEGGLNKVPGDPVIAAGYFAGVSAYNSNNWLGDLLSETVIATDDTITSVSWVSPSSIENINKFDPNTITIQPFNPGIIDIDPIDLGLIDPGNMIMSVPTPTYTDGDWGYELSGDNAKIVSYSGVGGDSITIPATVGGYNVVAVGSGNENETVFDTSISATDLIISEGITTISAYAFVGCSGFTGKLVLPSTITSFGVRSFMSCSGFTGDLVIPEGVTTIPDRCFVGCSGFTGDLVIPEGVTTLSSYCFSNCTGFNGSLIFPSTLTSVGSNVLVNSHCVGLVVLTDGLNRSLSLFNTSSTMKEALNLSSTAVTSTSFAMPNATVQDYIDASIYLAPDNYTVTEEIKTPNEYAPLYNILPLIILGSILLATAGIMILHRE